MRWYSRTTQLSNDHVKSKLRQFFAEDMPRGDASSNALFENDSSEIRAAFVAREDLVFCGIPVIRNAFPEARVNIYYHDGQQLTTGTVIAEISGRAADILSRERTVLNLLQRLSAVSTLTKKYVDKVEGRITILDTRKTTPGLRRFEKYAVTCGGGRNHRLDLSSGIMLKDNHIAAANSLENAVKRCRLKYSDLILEVEADHIEQLPEILKCNVDAVLLDNMPPETVAKAVEMIHAHPGGNKIFIEASGGISLKNVAEYTDTGINAVSIGALTHSAGAVDIALDFEA